MEALQFACIILIIPITLGQLPIMPWSMKRTLYFEEVRQCSDAGTKDIVWDLKQTRVSRQNSVIQGNITMKVPLDENVSVMFDVAEMSNGKWVEQALVFKLPYFCRDLMIATPTIWMDMWKKAGVPPPITCPIPKGNYYLRSLSTIENLKIISSLRIGKFKSTVEFLNKNNTRLGCTIFIIHTALSSEKL